MADRFPLILNTSNNQIQEIASGDQLDLSGNNVANAGIITATTFSGNLTGNVTGNINGNLTGTLQTAAQPNITSLGTLSSLNVSGNASIGGVLTYEDVTSVDSVGIITARAGINLTGGDITLGDSAGPHKLKFGAGADFQLFHNGSNNYIDVAGNGHLYIRPKANFYIQDYTNGEVWIDGTLNGGVKLYNNGIKKFETDGNGITVQGNINMATDSTLQLGVGNDFKLFHNGTTNYIRTANGNIVIDNNSGVANAVFRPAGAVELYHNGTKMLETIATGIKIPLSNNQDGLEFFSSGDIFPRVIGNTNRTLADKFLLSLEGIWNNNHTVAKISIETGNDTTNKDDGRIVFHTATSNGTIVERLKIEPNGNVLIPADNKKLQIGASQDLELFHDGSQSYITNATSDLRIRSGYIKLQGNNGENMLVANQNTSVELYYDNSKKIETTSSGIQMSGDILVQDNHRIKIGDSQDFEFYHNTSHSLIKNSTGRLYILSDDIWFKDKDDGDLHARFIHDGATELYYDNSKKFETNSSGAQVFGLLEADTLGLGDNDVLQLGNLAIGGNLRLYHNTSNSYIDNQATGHIFIRNNVDTDFNGNIIIQAKKDENSIVCNDDGSVELYHNNTKMLETTSFGAEVVYSSGAPDTAIFKVLHGNLSQGLAFGYHTISAIGTNTNVTLHLKSKGTSPVGLYHGSSLKFATTDVGVRVPDNGGYFDINGGYYFRGTGGSWNMRVMTTNTGSTSVFQVMDHATANILNVVQDNYVHIANPYNFYIGNSDTNYTSSDGIRFMGFGGNSARWFTNTFNNPTGGNTPGPYLYNRNGTHNGVRFYVKVDGGVVNHSGNNSNLCDERMKTNIVDAPSYWNSIKNIGIKKFNYKTEPEGTPLKVGVIAQQVETIESDLVDDDFAVDGNPNEEGATMMKSVHEEQLFMMAVKALQEAQARIETLEAEVAALKGS